MQMSMILRIKNEEENGWATKWIYFTPSFQLFTCDSKLWIKILHAFLMMKLQNHTGTRYQSKRSRYFSFVFLFKSLEVGMIFISQRIIGQICVKSIMWVNNPKTSLFEFLNGKDLFAVLSVYILCLLAISAQTFLRW